MSDHYARRPGALLIAAMIVAGCATPPAVRPPVSGRPPPAAVVPASPATRPAPVPHQQPAVVVPPATPATVDQPPPSAPVRALLEQGEAARSRGDDEAAVALLQRALRIEPRHPAPWLSLAELDLERGRTTTALQYARKALSLAGGGTALAARARDIIAASER